MFLLQVCAYRSSVADLFFYLWTSVKQSVLEKHLDELLHHYHQHLVDTLKTYNCYSEAFSYEDLLDAIRVESSFEFGHAVEFAIFVVHGKKGGSQMSSLPTQEHLLKHMSDKAKQKLFFMVLECDKRGWM